VKSSASDEPDDVPPVQEGREALIPKTLNQRSHLAARDPPPWLLNGMYNACSVPDREVGEPAGLHTAITDVYSCHLLCLDHNHVLFHKDVGGCTVAFVHED